MMKLITVHKLSWYQYLLLDVFALYATIAAFLGWIIYKMFACCCCKNKSVGKNPKPSQSKKSVKKE